ncbi:hypothetical protein [Argonema antarcticum]|uniref:hypothetical protein n=1 Tax=Argonema antarcticum TaxID=2942763 RepID=UPI0020117BE9|nr:hypothetical protein [Argonema antarcticum]MCL1469876.1 hypothetical protein [Argonema antarcticum A004/B2]
MATNHNQAEESLIEFNSTPNGLSQYLKHWGKTEAEQIEKNQAAIRLLRDWHLEKLEAEELEKQQAAFEVFKNIIDDNRTPERKLYSSL